ncbi:MAG: hypothetical protein IJ519_02145 [Clostridia bacterium]|nr:hypothetical protein [Clostridia bacterium]
MNYLGKWKFHSIGTFDEDERFVYLTPEEYLASPMDYVDTTDEEAVADELKERKQMVGAQIYICEDGMLYMLMPLPEGVDDAEVDAAVKAGAITLRDGMICGEPLELIERDGHLWLYDGLTTDGPTCITANEGFITIATTRYLKID